MPTKTTDNGRWTYHVDAKRFTWPATIDTDDGDEATVDITLPLRIKARLIRQIAKDDDADIETIFKMIEAVAPQQVSTCEDMDMAELSTMFATWQTEYQALAGASMGESDSSLT